MSGNNPYAVNGYGGSTNTTNPYGSSGPNPYASSGTTRYNDPYISQSNQSSTSVNSHGSRGERRPDERRPSRPSNPYEQRLPVQRPSPGPSVNSRESDSRYGAGGRGPGYGYDGMGAVVPQPPEYERSDRQQQQQQQQQQQTPPRPRTAGRDSERDRDRERDRTHERDRGYNDSRSRERRMAPDPQDLPPPPAIPAASSYHRQYSPRRPVKSMDEILRHIQREWKNMEGDDCIPVKVALQLMDPSSLGLGEREGDFADTHVDLQRSLKKVVNEQYADFNSAVGTYHKIQACIRDSQSRIRYLKNGLIETKSGMLTTRPELRGLAEQSGELDSLLQVLTQMENLRQIPTRLEERISEKRWIAAVELLTDALKSCRKSELDGIGAMSDLRSYFSSQETSLVDVLVEELHDHLYLKSPYCVDRWKGTKADGGERDAKDSFGGNTWDRPVYGFLATLDTKNPLNEDSSKNPEAETFSYIYTLVEALNKAGYLEEVISRVEQRMPIELYKVVERTSADIDAKYPSHLRGHLPRDKFSMLVPHATDNRTKVLSDLLWTLYAKFEAIAEGHRVLHEVVRGIVEREKLPKPEKYTGGFKELWKLYQMEIRSLLHDYLAAEGNMTLGKGVTTVTGTDIFVKHRDRNRKMFKLADMDEKNPDLEAEERELDDILKNSVPGLVSKSKTNPSLNSDERHTRDGTAAGHKLLVDASVFNMTILLPPSLAFLQHLKDIVPLSSSIPMSTLSSFLDDFLINVFYPQLEEAVTELCTQCMMDIEAFTEDSNWAQLSPRPVFKGASSFIALIKAFSEMLSAIPTDQMFTQLIINQLVSFHNTCHNFYTSMVSRIASETSNSDSNDVKLKPAAALAESGDVRDNVGNLLNSAAGQQNQKALSRTIVQQLLSAVKISPISAYDLMSDPKSVHQLSLLHNSMYWLASSLLQLRHIESGSLSRKSHSRNTSQANQGVARRWTLITNLQTPSMASTVQSATVSVYLPLTSETAISFDSILQSMRELGEKSLMTIYLDTRYSIIYQLGRALRPMEPEPGETGLSQNTAGLVSGNLTDSPSIDSGLYPFVLPSPPTSASPRILELNSDLISFDANISACLGVRERRFILLGLGMLVDRCLVVGADYIQVMNREGAERMRVDAMVIQQVLRGLGVNSTTNGKLISDFDNHDEDASQDAVGLGISSPVEGSGSSTALTQNGIKFNSSALDDDSLLVTSSQYYELFLQGPDAIMQYVRKRKDAATSEFAATASSSTSTADKNTTTTNNNQIPDPTAAEVREQSNDSSEDSTKSQQPPTIITTTNPPAKQQQQQPDITGAVGFTYDELRTLIELCFSAMIKSHDREESIRARRKMDDLLLQLGEVMWDS